MKTLKTDQSTSRELIPVYSEFLIDEKLLKVHYREWTEIFKILWFQNAMLERPINHEWSFSEFKQVFENICNLKINYLKNNIDFKLLPQQPKILDIGAGNSLADIFLYQYLDGGTFYLLDGDYITRLDQDVEDIKSSNPIYKYWGKAQVYPCKWQTRHDFYPIYNTWNSVVDAIKNTKLNQEDFKFLDPNSEWPGEIDLITSWWSCGYHYSIESYWNKIETNLKIGGQLCMVIIHNKEGLDWINFISEKMNCSPTVEITPTPPGMQPDQLSLVSEEFKDKYAGIYNWIRK